MPFRRRAPGWIRDQSQVALHRLAGKLANLEQEQDLSVRQEWLFGVVLNELEYRSRQMLWWQRCSCRFCAEPFPWDRAPDDPLWDA